MPRPPILATLVALAAVTAAGAADLSRVERRIVKRPALKSASPRYCLLVFGPEAKTRVWLVLDGDHLYVDRNGNGDLTEPGERVHGPGGHSFNAGDIVEAGGKSRHTVLVVGTYAGRVELSVRIDGKRQQSAGEDRNGRLEFAGRPENAPVVHFNGPLEMDLFREQRPLRSGARGRLNVVVGTPGLGKGTFAHLDCGAYPPNVWPAAEIEYPPKRPHETPVVQRVRLEDD